MARPPVESILNYLQRFPAWVRSAVAGSFRRCKETVGDIDILVTAGPDSPVMERFAAFEDAGQVLAQGPTKSSIVLRSGLQVDLRRVEQGSFGAALQYFTGSQAHNIAVAGSLASAGSRSTSTECSVSTARSPGRARNRSIGRWNLPWIPPELREDRGEIEAAREGRLLKLVEIADVKGELHSHTSATDGRNSLEEMALAANAAG